MSDEQNQDQQQEETASHQPEQVETPVTGGPPRSFRDQPIYQLAFDFQKRVYETTKVFPEEELFALTEPLRKASRMIGAAVAEAWTKRRFQAHYPMKLSEVEAQAAAADHWISTAEQCGFLPAEATAELHAIVETIRGHVWRMTPRPQHGQHVGGSHHGGGDRRPFRPNPGHDRGPRQAGEEPPRRDDEQNRNRPRRNFRNNEGGGRFFRNNRPGYSNTPRDNPREGLPADDFRDSEPPQY